MGFSIEQFNLVSRPFRSVMGEFQVYAGAIQALSEDLNNAKIDFSVIVGSIYTGNGKRDRHLRSSAFFDAEQFPMMKFSSVAFIKVRGDQYVLEGDLSIRGVSRRIVFDVVEEPLSRRLDCQAAQFIVTGKMNRFDFGIKGPALSEIFIGKEVTISLKLEFVKQ
jgi:polyisoprenoid-binding protein YceI